MEIKNAENFFISFFLKASPKNFSKDCWQDIKQEVSLFIFLYRPFIGEYEQGDIKKLSNILQSKAYYFWKEQGWRKIKYPEYNGTRWNRAMANHSHYGKD